MGRSRSFCRWESMIAMDDICQGAPRVGRSARSWIRSSPVKLVSPGMLLGPPRLPLWAWAAALSAAVIAIAIAWVSAERVGVERLRDAGTHKLDLYAGSLDSALGKYEYLPGVAALRNEVVALARDPAAFGLQQTVNLYLAEVNAKANSSVLYVLDPRGHVLASSNWNEEASFVGMDLGYRPYVRDALERGAGRFYGIGTTSGKPGFYHSQAIRDHGEVIGVVAVKVSLDHVEIAWSHGGDLALVVDAGGVVFLASDAEWKFRTYGPLAPAAADLIETSRQYAGLELLPLGITVESPAIEGVRIVAAAPQGVRRRYLELVHETPEPTWRLLLLMDYAPVNGLIRNSVALTVVALAFVFLLLFLLLQRRRALQASLAAKEALQQAHDLLERKVAARTADLVAANQQLNREIAERHVAEVVLREAQDQLIHAGKMAVLGQMSAGITHELNQPLAALRTLSDNARVLLEKDRIEDVQKNLALISQLTERMGKITGQLKTFARKSPLRHSPVSVRRALGNALALVEQRVRTEQIAITQDLPADDVEVWADANRLEQVLVNLIVNALDAMKGAPLRQLAVLVDERAGRVSITVRDTGSGIAADHLPRLFEPFVTTKEPGAGLGLGLAISSGIIGEFGGSLVAVNRPERGAEFTIELGSARGMNVA
jgi:two-component system C4-dicarboxylate transport sensor histidine kinase DctB